uniref:Ig-like domain-containing protein n=1 Tax=Seriola dumerili TaxID=41447 RepID=A0A3B4VP49_SERDU
MSLTLLLATLGLLVLRRKSFLTQSPGSQVCCSRTDLSLSDVKPGSSVSYDMQWYLQKPGEAPKLLIYDDTNRLLWSSRSFSGSKSGVQTEDAGAYYCQQSESFSVHTVDTTSYKNLPQLQRN